MFKLSNWEISQVLLGKFVVSKQENTWIVKGDDKQWEFENYGIPYVRTISNCHFLIFKNYTQATQTKIYVLVGEWHLLNFDYLHDDERGICVIDHNFSIIRLLTGYDQSGIIKTLVGDEITLFETPIVNCVVKYYNREQCMVFREGLNMSSPEFGSIEGVSTFHNSLLKHKYLGRRWDNVIAPYIIEKNHRNYVIDDEQCYHELPAARYTQDQMTYWFGNYFLIDGQPYGFLNKRNVRWLEHHQKNYIFFILLILNRSYPGMGHKIGKLIPKNVLLEHILVHTLSYKCYDIDDVYGESYCECWDGGNLGLRVW